MNTEHDLLAAVRENPDDDLPRSILADWLLDQPTPSQQARGEFIHLQCQLAGPNPGSNLQQRITALQNRYLHDWLGPLAGACQNVLFDRGMMRLVIVGPSDSASDLSKLAALPPWNYVDGLILRDWSAEQLKRLFTLPQLSNLSLLVINMNPTPANVWSRLAESPHLSNLRRLRLPFTYLGIEGIRAVAGSSSLRSLVELDLCGNNIEDEGLQALSCSPVLQTIKELDLRHNRLHAQGIRFLIDSPMLGPLQILNLEHNFIDDQGVAALASSSRLSQLTQLGLISNNCGTGGALSLVRSRSLEKLQRLSYDFQGVDHTCREELMRRFFPHLSHRS